MRLTPDSIVFWQWGPVNLNATIVYTWAVMALMCLAAWLVRRRVTSGADLTPGQNLLEVIVVSMRNQIREIGGHAPEKYLPFVGTLFLYIAIANLLGIVPGYEPPTGSLSTTAALALCVFFAVPIYGIAQRGLLGYLKRYIQPSPLMLPFHIIGELSRTLALAIRLFGNVMSGTIIVAILLAIVPLLFPVLLQLLGLITGLVQAYIFAVLAMVYIASATRVSRGAPTQENPEVDKE